MNKWKLSELIKNHKNQSCSPNKPNLKPGQRRNFFLLQNVQEVTKHKLGKKTLHQ